MIRLTFVAAIAAALLVPAVASAKGPTSASISGPGFAKKITVRNDGSGGTPGGDLTQQAGFFPAAFGQTPDPMLHRRPAHLGPRYTILWNVPGGTVFHVRQEVYPYAHGGAVTYMKPGQPIFDMTTRGGWYRDPQLKRTLVGLGLAKGAPDTGSGDATSWFLVGGLLAGAVLVATVVALWRRQRGQRSPSTSSTELPAGSRT
jgi:LPXTG-motif cell wall-anchored protein